VDVVDTFVQQNQKGLYRGMRVQADVFGQIVRDAMTEGSRRRPASYCIKPDSHHAHDRRRLCNLSASPRLNQSGLDSAGLESAIEDALGEDPSFPFSFDEEAIATDNLPHNICGYAVP
jgi:hypothetical protein